MQLPTIHEFNTNKTVKNCLYPAGRDGSYGYHVIRNFERPNVKKCSYCCNFRCAETELKNVRKVKRHQRCNVQSLRDAIRDGIDEYLSEKDN
jgi:hypothetical protein